MSKAWLVGRFEYLTLVRRRSFVLATVGFPLLMAAVIGFAIVLATSGEDKRPLGYVDQAGVVTLTPEQAGVEPAGALVAFANRAAAEAALQNGTVHGYVMLPPGYRQGEKPTFVIMSEEDSQEARARFDDYLRANLVAGQPALSLINVLLPFVAGFFFVYVVISSSGYLLQAVTTEKENRTVEIMATSLSPLQLIGGKSGGLLAVALTQLAVWIGSLALALVIGAFFVPALRAVEVSGSLVLVILLYFIPSFALMGGFMIAIGSAVTELQQGQQIGGILNLLFMAPFFVLVVLFANPDGPLAVAMTLFPTTSFLTITLRWGLTTVPAWQLALSWLLLVGSALVTVWLAARVFRVGMLNYGQRLDWASIKAALRSGRTSVSS